MLWASLTTRKRHRSTCAAAGAVAVLVATVTGQSSSATDIEPGQARQIDWVRAELAAAPDSVPLHLRLQGWLLWNGATPRHVVAGDYARRLRDKGASPGNRYLAVRFGEGDPLLRALRGLIDDHPDSPWGYFGMGEALATMADFPGARAYFGQAIQKAPNVPMFSLRLAAAFAGEDKTEAALAVLDGLAARWPDDADVAVDQVRYLRMQGKYAEAVAKAKDVLKRHPENPSARIRMAQAYYEAGQFPEAIIEFEASLENWPNDKSAWFRLCYAASIDDSRRNFGRIKSPKVIDICLNAIRHNPKEWSPAYMLALAWHSASRDSPVHVAYFSARALGLNPPKSIAEQLARNRGTALNALSGGADRMEYRRSRDYVTTRDGLTEADRQGLAKHGEVAAWQALEQAMVRPSPAELDALVARFPEFAPAYFDRGMFAYNNCCKVDPFDDLAKAATLAPSWARALSALAVQMLKRKMFAQARAALLAARTADPEDDIVRHNIDLMVMFDTAVVDETVVTLEAILDRVKQTGDVDAVGRMSRLLRRDPTSHRIHELYGDIHAASKNKAHWPDALDAYRTAAALGADKTALRSKIAKVEARMK